MSKEQQCHLQYSTNDSFSFLIFQIKLKKVLGLTVCSNAALDVSPTTGVLAYPAGYVHNNNKNCSTFSFLAIETCDISIFHSIRAIDFYVSIEH